MHGDLRVVAQHLHAEAQRGVGDFDADGAEADDAERAARQFEADEVLLALLDRDVDGVIVTLLRLGEGPGLADVARGQEHAGEHQLFHGIGVGARAR